MQRGATEAAFLDDVDEVFDLPQVHPFDRFSR
jgi:hypothetical protein